MKLPRGTWTGNLVWSQILAKCLAGSFYAQNGMESGKFSVPLWKMEKTGNTSFCEQKGKTRISYWYFRKKHGIIGTLDECKPKTHAMAMSDSADVFMDHKEYEKDETGEKDRPAD